MDAAAMESQGGESLHSVIYDAIEYLIQMDIPEEVPEVLRQLDVENMTLPVLQQSLGVVLVILFEADASDLVKEVIDVYAEGYAFEDIIPLRTRVYVIDGMPEGFFDFYFKCYEGEIDYSEQVRDLFNYTTEADIVAPLRRITDAYAINDPQIFKSVLNDLDRFYTETRLDLPYIREFFMFELQKVSPIATDSDVAIIIPTPIVISNTTIELPTHDELLYRLEGLKAAQTRLTPSAIAAIVMNTEAAIIRKDVPDYEDVTKEVCVDGLSMLLNMASSANVVGDMSDYVDPDTNENLGANASNLGDVNFIDNATADPMAKVYVQPDQEDEIYRILGPSNSPMGYIGTEGESGGNPCMEYGSCRMLTCQEYRVEYVDEESNNSFYSDWFKGWCSVCSERIAKKHEAVRMPLDHGGWLGCYCSWECVRNDTDEDTVKASTYRYEKEYRTRKIYDRIWPDEEDIPVSDELFLSVWDNLKNWEDHRGENMI